MLSATAPFRNQGQALSKPLIFQHSRPVKFYLLRHGKADWPSWDKPDDDRPLTEDGKDQVAAVAKMLARLEIAPAIVSSPLPRASQTAEIAGKYLGQKVRIDPLLRPGFDAGKLKKLLKDFSGDSLMVVGHEPDFTQIIFELTGGRTKLSKAAVALIELNTRSMKGELRWLVPPKFAKN
jgi:phosphohistidine phosphatase